MTKRFLFLVLFASATLIPCSSASAQTSGGSTDEVQVDGQEGGKKAEAVVTAAILSRAPKNKGLYLVTAAGKAAADGIDGLTRLDAVDLRDSESKLLDSKLLSGKDEPASVSLSGKTTFRGFFIVGRTGESQGVEFDINLRDLADSKIAARHKVLLPAPTKPAIKISAVSRPMLFGKEDRLGVLVENPYREEATIEVEWMVPLVSSFPNDDLFETCGNLTCPGESSRWVLVNLDEPPSPLFNGNVIVRCTAIFEDNDGKTKKIQSNQVGLTVEKNDVEF